MRNLLLIAIFVFFITACGKKGALYYPDMLVPVAPTAISVNQIGSTVKLEFTLPDKDATDRKLYDLGGVKITKRENDPYQELVCNSCTTDYFLFRKLYLDLLPDGTRRFGNRILMLDGNVKSGKTYSYILIPFTKDGVDGVASTQVSVRLFQPALPPVIQSESLPAEIKISFVSLPPVAGSFLGYNIYRTSQQGLTPYLPLNREPWPGKEYIDSTLERNLKYYYVARMVVKLESGEVVESLLSNVVDGTLKND